MGNNPACPLCAEDRSVHLPFQKEPSSYYGCPACDLKFLDPGRRLSVAEEEERYGLHENHLEDPGYRNFLKPLLDVILERHPSGSRGLDFGAGGGPLLAQMLKENGYEVDLYDPFFWSDPAPLEKKFDFIVTSEVFEHLYHPRREIELLKGCLRPGATLAVMTSLTDGVDFENWYYRRDPTHVCFYSSRTMKWIENHFGFTRMQIENKRTTWFET